MKKSLTSLILATLLLQGCDLIPKRYPSGPRPNNGVPMQDIEQIKANLAFDCAYEKDHLPPLDPEADQLFQYGRWLQTQRGEKTSVTYAEIGRLYRIANAHGHYKANNNLHSLLANYHVYSEYPREEAYELTQQLISAGIPFGYYFMAYYLERGYGVKGDQDLAMKYYRKAADLGNADAQYLIGDKLLPYNMAPDIGRKMLTCSAEQGHAKAANRVGFSFQGKELYPEALRAFQLAAKYNEEGGARFLSKAFGNPPPPPGGLYYLAVEADPERARRYTAIQKFLDKYEFQGKPTVPDIDQIVPLPPAKLPEWDGTFQWEKEFLARKAPAKPSEEMIARMAKAKNLDPATGLAVKQK